MGTEPGSDTARVEWNGSHAEGKHTRPIGDSTTESSWKEDKGYGERAGDSNRITQHQVREGGGFGVSAAGTIARQCWYWNPTGEKVDRGDPRVLQRRLQGMGDGSGEQTQGRHHHRLARRGGMEG